ncbi:MAG: BatD family protein [Planctomycetaceae bacterium]|jgi:hypothetical protein|nr:BatD family protein [Planctomycetaceae bacterium]
MKTFILNLQLLFNNFFIVRAIFFLIILQIFNCSLSAELSTSIAIDRSVIYKGERITYKITIADSKPIDSSISPDLSGFNDFDVRVFPKQVLNNSGSSLRVVINGQVIRDESSTQSKTVFNYELTPKKSGKLIIPPPIILSGSQKLTPTSVLVADKSDVGGADGSFTITVKSPEDQSVVKMRIETDRNRIYPFQSFIVTLVVQVKSLPPTILQPDASPLSILRDPPNLTINWADDSSLPKGLRPVTPLNEWLNSILTPRSQRGFAINEYATRNMDFSDDFFNNGTPIGGFGSIMNEMMKGRVLHFAPTPKKIVVQDAAGTDVTYWEYRFSRKFTADEIGDYKFDAIIKGSFVVENKNSRDGASLQRVYAVAPETTVKVVDIPLAGRPSSYIGAFGKFDLKTDIQPRKAKRGEPMTLTFKLVGEGSTGNVKPPDLIAIQEVTSNFKVHSPTEEGDNNSCTFTYPIRATQSGQIIFPSIPITYFDVQNDKFVTLQSEPINLEIADSEQINGGFTFGGNNSAIGNFERSERGLLANMADRSDIVNQSVDYLRWAALLGGLVVAYVVIGIILFLWRRLESDPQKRRQSGAISKARVRLNRVKQNLKSNNSSDMVIQYGDELQNLLFGYIADLSCASENGMTTKDACKKYLEIGGEKELSDILNKVLETLDGTKYGGLDLKSLDDIVISIEKILARPINVKK